MTRPAGPTLGPTLAVFAHFDPYGEVAGHVQRYLAELADAVDRLVVVSTAELTASGRRTLERHAEVVRRENVGYDFYSWKTGFDHAGDWDSFARVMICNDSVAGPFRPMREILVDRAPSDADFWGMTASHEISPHVQSWFVVFERPVIESGLLHGFWRAMEPVSDRYHVIRRYEVGLSRLLLTGGMRMGSYLQPRPVEALRAELRHRRAKDLRAAARRPKGTPATGAKRAAAAEPPTPPTPPRSATATLLAPFRAPEWNPTYVLWDAVFDGRLPFVKLEVLRDDPYRLGREVMLGRLEAAFPDQMAGVREYLDRTREELRRLRGVDDPDE